MLNNLDTFQDQINESFTGEGVQLINKFFISFSRIEFALKATGFIHPNADPDWSGFIASIRNDFNSNFSEDIKDSFDYIIQHPPRIQTVENGSIKWENREFNNDPEIHRLSQHIRDIRNNLFHGAKYHGNYEPEASRNYKLIRSSLSLLDYIISLNQDVLSKFLEPIEN